MNGQFRLIPIAVILKQIDDNHILDANGVKLPIQCTNFLNVTEYKQLARFYGTTTAMDEDPNI